MDVNAIESIISSNLGITGGTRTSSAAGTDANGMANLVGADFAAQSTRVQISEQSKQINELYNAVSATGNAEALDGLRGFFTDAASRFDWTAIGNVTEMGTEALANDRGDFVTSLFANYNALSDSAEGSILAYNTLTEAGDTFRDLGLAAAESFGNAVDAIMRAEMPEGSTVTNREVLRDFTSTWRDVRASGAEDEQRAEELGALSRGVMEGQNTVDIEDFISQFGSTPA